MPMDNKFKDAHCNDSKELLYRQQSSQIDYLKGFPGYCLCEAYRCPYYQNYKNSSYCNVQLKRMTEKYKL